MKKILLVTIISGLTLTSALFAQQHQQSLTFTGPTMWTAGTSVTLAVNLSINYNAYGYSCWLEVPAAIAPFLSVVDLRFPPMIQRIVLPSPCPFKITGARPGYVGETCELGVGAPSGVFLPGVTYVADITFAVAAEAPAGTYAMYTTNNLPRSSEVTDTDFNDNNFGPNNPPGGFIFQVVPQPAK